MTNLSRRTVIIDSTDRLHSFTLTCVTRLTRFTVFVRATNRRVRYTLAALTNLTGRTFIVIATTLSRNTKTKLTLLELPTVIVRPTLGWWNWGTHAGNTAQTQATFLVALAAIRGCTDVVDALQIGDGTIAFILTEEGRQAATRYTGEFTATVIVVSAYLRDTASLITALAVTTVGIVKAVRSRQTDARRICTIFTCITLAIDLAALQFTTQVTNALKTVVAVVIDKTFDIINALLVQSIAHLTGTTILVPGAPTCERTATVQTAFQCRAISVVLTLNRRFTNTGIAAQTVGAWPTRSTSALRETCAIHAGETIWTLAIVQALYISLASTVATPLAGRTRSVEIALR